MDRFAACFQAMPTDTASALCHGGSDGLEPATSGLTDQPGCENTQRFQGFGTLRGIKKRTAMRKEVCHGRVHVESADSIETPARDQGSG